MFKIDWESNIEIVDIGKTRSFKFLQNVENDSFVHLNSKFAKSANILKDFLKKSFRVEFYAI